MLSKFADLHQLGAEIFEIQKKTPVPLVVVAGEKICHLRSATCGFWSYQSKGCYVQRFGAKKLSWGFLAASGNLMSGFLVVVFSCSFCMFASFGAAVFAEDFAAARNFLCSLLLWLLVVESWVSLLFFSILAAAKS